LSPNGDGILDHWLIEGIEFFPNNFVQVFDRYNSLVFEIRNYDNNGGNFWDGRSNKGVSNRNVPTGTYFYIINLGDGSELISGFVMVKKD